MEKCIRLYREEMALREMRDAESAYDLSRVYSKRQERLELMASRVVTVEACGSLGSGVMLDTRGHIATNAHVVATSSGICPKIIVTTADGWQGTARVAAGEFEQDIVILRAEGARNFWGVEIAPRIYLGQDVFAVGHPLGRSHTVTRGIISYVRRIIGDRPYVQTDASINPGNSGGGLFDELGRLVGLPTFKEVWADRIRTIPVANIGFAVPGDVVQEFYTQALQQRRSVSCAGNPAAVTAPFILA
ncbi:MAG TPA: trypsin-like peptidase domain-containing protein [Bacillota bacterium]|nr:trypsin-like peptidase domain-containing protein [Bacillota bacterium]HQE01681.1 trypsin-like peptidase domain-containing protein [Bacillota bacterium]